MACLLVMALGLLVSSCTLVLDPVIVNNSGSVAHLSAQYDNDRTVEHDLPNGRLLWCGHAKIRIVSAVITVGDAVYRLGTSDLTNPLPGENKVAYILDQQGLRKTTFTEAKRVGKSR